MHLIRIPLSKTQRKKYAKMKARARRNFRKDTSIGFVYVFSLGHDNLYKIGLTTDYTKRLKALQASNPLLKPIICRRVPNARSSEKYLHGTFGQHRVDREVFQLQQEQLNNIDSFLAEQQQSLVHPTIAIPSPD